MACSQGKNSELKRQFGQCTARCNGLCVFEEPLSSGNFFYFDGTPHSQDHPIQFVKNDGVRVQAPKWLKNGDPNPKLVLEHPKIIEAGPPARHVISTWIEVPTPSSIKGLSELFGYIVRKFQERSNIGPSFVGEEQNLAECVVTLQTRHLPARLRRHIICNGEAGSGKTSLIRQTLKGIRKDDVLHYTRLTGAGLDRFPKSFDGKVLFLEQLEGNEPTQLKLIMSEGELLILLSEREDGKWVSKEHHVSGMPVMISTIVGARIDGQLLSRSSNLEIDESDQHTKEIEAAVLEDAASVCRLDESRILGPLLEIDRVCREFGQYVQDIKLPFAQQLFESLPGSLAMRRGLPRLLNLIRGFAFIKTAVGLREFVEIQNEGAKQVYVIAMPEDLDDALFCLGKRLQESIMSFFGRSRNVYDYLLSHPTSDAKAVGLGVVPRLSQNRAREYLNALVDQGHATRTKTGATYNYEAIPDSTPQITLEANFSHEEIAIWLGSNFKQGEARLTRIDTPLVVFVVPPLEAVTGTVGEIVPEIDTKQSIVPEIAVNDGNTNTNDGVNERTGVEYLARLGSGFGESPESLAAQLSNALSWTPEKALSLVNQLRHEGRILANPEGRWGFVTK